MGALPIGDSVRREVHELRARGMLCKDIGRTLGIGASSITRILAEPLLSEVTGEEWPWPVGEHLIEPACGVVRVRRRSCVIELPVGDVRVLARSATPDLAAVLGRAVGEAERQREAIGEAMGT